MNADCAGSGSEDVPSPGEKLALAQALREYRTLLDPLRSAPDEVAFATMWHPGSEPEFETRTFGEFRQRAERFAGLFRDRGVSRGDTVILILPQGIDLMEGFVGVQLLGAIPTILAYPNFKIDPDKYRVGLSGVANNIGARLAVVDTAFPDDLAQRLESSSRVLKVTDQALRGVRPVEHWEQPASQSVAFLQHSAGTTGLQKGVALSHAVVLNQLWELAVALKLRRDDRVASWLPLYHDMGLIACFILPLACHIPVVMQSPVDWVLKPESFLELITRFGCTLGWVPNFTFQFLARRVGARSGGVSRGADADRMAFDLSTLRALITTSEPIRLHSMEEFRAAFATCGLSDTALQTSYGMAENTFAVTQSRIDRSPPHLWVDRDQLQKRGTVATVDAADPRAASFVSCGRPLGTAEIKIVGPGGDDLGEGRLGEIVVRSRSMYSGYFNRPDLTSRVLRDGWYWTRDVGFLWDGELYAIGRKDDTIIVGGRNLYPQDIEEAAFSHPAVRDGRAVAFGLENPDLGTEDLIVVAEVESTEILHQQATVTMEIRQAIQSEVGVAPRVVHLVPPKWVVKSTAGKPARSSNREKFLRERPEFRRETPREP